MTELQDEICDRLVGQPIGRNRVGGPLHVAALVIDPAFTPASGSDARPGQFAQAVGWPVTFSEALTGANAALDAEADRRSLAVTLFARVPPRPGRMSGAVSRPAAAWAVLLAHASACAADCPLHVAVVASLKAVEDGKPWRTPFGRGTDCRSAPGLRDVVVTPSSPAAHHAAVAVRYLNAMMGNPRDGRLARDAIREAAKAETKVRSVDGAAAFCLTLAEKLGLLTAGV